MIAFWITLTAIAFLIHLALHESAHALALRRSLGGDIRQAGLGLPLPPLLAVAPRGRRQWEFTLSPWLLGAYVIPDQRSEKLIEDAPYVKQAWFSGAGVVVNLITGLAVWSLLDAVRGDWWHSGLLLAAATVSWFARKVITFILPAIGIAALVFLVITLAQTVGEPQGPVGVARVLAEATTGDMALNIIGAIGLSLATLNTIPIFPFDGGRVADAALRAMFPDRIATGYRAVSSVAALALMLYVIGSDAWSLMT